MFSRDIDHYIRGYVRRADAREAERSARWRELRERAAAIARSLRETYGERVRVVLFGSITDADRTVAASDIDIAVEGLSPSEYWDAWRRVEPLAGDARLDFIRLEGAGQALRRAIESEGEEIGT